MFQFSVSPIVGISVLARQLIVVGLGYPKWLAAFVVFAVLAGTLAAHADPLPPPMVNSVFDSNGVNLNNGHNQIPGPSVSIGQPDQGGLTYTALWRDRVWDDNFASNVSYDSHDCTKFTVELMNSSSTFTYTGSCPTTPGCPSGSFTASDGTGQTLVCSGGNYTFTAHDGTVAVYSAANIFPYSIFTVVGLPSTVTRPNGEVLTFSMAVVSGSPGIYLLNSVTNNLGYQIKLFYSGTGATQQLAQVVAINNAIDYCAPFASSCSFSQTWATLSYTYSNITGGYQIAIQDIIGKTTTASVTFVVTPTQVIERITYPSGRYTVFADTDADTFIDQVYDGSTTSTPWQYSYSSSGTTNTTTITDPLGHVRQVDTSNLNGALTKDTLDPSGLNLITTYTLDATTGLVTDVILPEGNYKHYTYDARGNITQITEHPKSGSSLSPVNSYAAFPSSCTSSNYRICNKPTAVIDGNGNETDYTYDAAHGGVLTQTSPSVNGGRPQINFTYTAYYAWYKDSSGNIVPAGSGSNWGAVSWGSFNWSASSSGPVYKLTQTSQCLSYSGSSCASTAQQQVVVTNFISGSSSVATNLQPHSVFVYDGASNVITAATTDYDNWGNAAAVTAGLTGSTRFYFFDATQRLIGSVDPDPESLGSNHATQVTYEDDGQVANVVQGTTVGTSYAAWSTTFSSVGVLAYSYDSNTGLKIGEYTIKGGTGVAYTQYSYDLARRLQCTAVRNNISASSQPACTATTSGTYAPDLITQNNYDNANRLTSVVNGYGSGSPITESMTLTANSLLGTATDGNSNTTTFSYDGLDRPSQTAFPGGTLSESYTHDNNGNLLSRTLRNGDTINFSYDALNRLTLLDMPGGTSNDIYYNYDLIGDRLYAHYGSTGGSGVDYTYNAAGWKLSETSYGRTVTSQYDVDGNRTALVYPDSNYIQYTYDVLDRMLQVKQSGSTTLATYAYDALGRVSTITRGNSTTTTMTYNATALDYSMAHSGLSQSVTWGMALTPAGQVYQRSVSNTAYAYTAPAASISYSTNALNQYSSVNSTTYSYDNMGNLTSDGSRSFSYDDLNRLTSATGYSSINYDPLGRLKDTTASSTTEQYLYDGDRLIEEFDGSGNVLRRYVPGQSTDETLVWYEGSAFSTPNWLYTDQQGSVIAAANSSATTTPYAYSTSGEPSSWGSSPPTPIFRYTGQAALPAAQIYFYKARMYDPKLGRFLQTDPIGYDGGMNLYAYVGNDPANQTDPDGRGCGDTTFITDSNGKSVEQVEVCPNYGPGFDPNSDPRFGPSGSSGTEPTVSPLPVRPTAPITKGTNQNPIARKTPTECLIEAAGEHGLDTLADTGLLVLSFTPGGAAVKIGGTFALTAIGIANNVYFHSPTGAILPVFGAQFSAIDTAVEQPAFEQLGILRTFARGFGGLSLARDAFLIAQQYQRCVKGG